MATAEPNHLVNDAVHLTPVDSPFYDLPDELISLIFDFSCNWAQDTLVGKWVFPVVLLKVCKWWRRIALCTPNLWTSIIICTNQHTRAQDMRAILVTCEKRISLARALPLSLLLADRLPRFTIDTLKEFGVIQMIEDNSQKKYPTLKNGDEEKLAYDPTIDFLKKHGSRWGKIRCTRFGLRAERPDFLLPSSLPSLLEIEVLDMEESPNQTQPLLCRISAPNLQTMTITGVDRAIMIDWSTTHPSSLSELNISYPVNAIAKSFMVLASFVNLRTLALRDPASRAYAWYWHLFTTEDGFLSFSLPNLEKLTIDGISYTFIVEALTVLSAPKLLALAVCTSPDDTLPSLPKFDFPSLQSFGYLGIRAEDQDTYFIREVLLSAPSLSCLVLSLSEQAGTPVGEKLDEASLGSLLTCEDSQLCPTLHHIYVQNYPTGAAIVPGRPSVVVTHGTVDLNMVLEDV